MEAFEETVKEGTKRGSSFVDHVFRLDEQQQGVLLNIVQYTIIGFIPILVMLYLVRPYVPEPDDHKATLMILVESTALSICFSLRSCHHHCSLACHHLRHR